MSARTFGRDMVLMPVELRFAPQVAELLESLRAGGQSQRPIEAEEPDEAVVEVPGEGVWSRSMVSDLLEQLPYPGVVALFDLCAARAGDWVPKADAETEAGISAVQLRNELGALSKASKRIWGRATWPVQVKKERAAYLYRMAPTLATWWQDARGGQR